MPERPHLKPFLHDLYAPLNHVIGDTTAFDRTTGIVPTWVNDTDARRLTAYRALSAYLDNARRYWLGPAMWEGQAIPDGRGGFLGQAKAAAEGYREYGHPALLVNTARSLLLGQDQTVTATSDDDQDSPTLTWLVDWAETERLTAKILQGEEDAIGLGDTVYVLGWNARVQRPKLRVFDPGFYFPDWDAIDNPAYLDWGDEDFPPIIHLAWENEREDGTTWVRRTTWTMTRTAELRTMPYTDGAFPPTTWTCTYRVEEWRTDRLDGRDIYHLPAGTGTVIVADTDLGIDFIPVVAVPNDFNKHGFGRSLLLGVAQLLDDLSAADTDLSTDAALVASPPTVTKGVSSPLDAGPGATWEVGAEGSAAILDTSSVLDALLKHADRLEDLLSTRSRVASVLLGKVDPSDAASGYAMRLGLAPTQALLNEMEQVRSEKYPLLLKFAARIAQVNGARVNGVALTGATPRVRLDLSSGMPTAREAAIEEAVELFKARAVSTVTLVTLLRDAGLPIEDVDVEVGRLLAERVEEAVALVEATGDVAAARKRLGLDVAVTPPVVVPAPSSDPANLGV